MEALSKELTTKLQFLEFKNTKTEEIVQGGNVETIERHLNALRKLSRKADDLKLQIEEKKVSSGVALDDVTTWSNEVEAKLASVDESVVVTGKRLNEIKRKPVSKGEKRKTFLCRRKGKSFWNLSEPSLN